MTDTTTADKAAEGAKAEITKARRRYEQAQAKRDEAMRLLTDAMVSANHAGVSKNEVQRISGLARQTVYRVLS